jgi:hypothetical protein
MIYVLFSRLGIKNSRKKRKRLSGGGKSFFIQALGKAPYRVLCIAA